MVTKEKKELIKKLKKMWVTANANWKIETLNKKIKEIEIMNDVDNSIDKTEKTPSVTPQQESTLEKAMWMMLQSQVQLWNKIEKFIDSITNSKKWIMWEIIEDDTRSTESKITSSISYKTAYNVHPFWKRKPWSVERDVSPYKSWWDFITREKAIEYWNKAFWEWNFRINQISIAQSKQQ